MDKFEKKQNIITGLDMETGEKLPAVEIKNEVVWINDDVEMPFNFEEDKPSKIGVFLTPEPNEQEPVFHVKVMDNHFRSALLGKVVFKDNEGNLYRDVDIKGMGPISPLNSNDPFLMVESVEAGSARNVAKGKTPWGFLDWGFAETDRDMSEFFIKQGLRTHRALAIIRLDEIIAKNGEKISVSKARKFGYIKYTTEPVIEVRAFGTKARIADAKDQVLSEDAKHIVAQELGKDPYNFSKEDYVQWFAQTLGKQVAIIHNAGFIHGYLTDHNITLDCRIVDLDSVKKIKTDKWLDDKQVKNDLLWAIRSLNWLGRFQDIKGGARNNLTSDFFDSYISNLTTKVNPEDIISFKRSVLNEVVIE